MSQHHNLPKINQSLRDSLKNELQAIKEESKSKIEQLYTLKLRIKMDNSISDNPKSRITRLIDTLSQRLDSLTEKISVEDYKLKELNDEQIAEKIDIESIRKLFGNTNDQIQKVQNVLPFNSKKGKDDNLDKFSEVNLKNKSPEKNKDTPVKYRKFDSEQQNHQKNIQSAEKAKDESSKLLPLNERTNGSSSSRSINKNFKVYSVRKPTTPRECNKDKPSTTYKFNSNTHESPTTFRPVVPNDDKKTKSSHTLNQTPRSAKLSHRNQSTSENKDKNNEIDNFSKLKEQEDGKYVKNNEIKLFKNYIGEMELDSIQERQDQSSEEKSNQNINSSDQKEYDSANTQEKDPTKLNSLRIVHDENDRQTNDQNTSQIPDSNPSIENNNQNSKAFGKSTISFNSDLKREIDDLKSAMTDCKSEVFELKCSLNEMQKQNNQCEIEISSLRKQNEKLLIEHEKIKMMLEIQIGTFTKDVAENFHKNLESNEKQPIETNRSNSEINTQRTNKTKSTAKKQTTEETQRNTSIDNALERTDEAIQLLSPKEPEKHPAKIEQTHFNDVQFNMKKHLDKFDSQQTGNWGNNYTEQKGFGTGKISNNNNNFNHDDMNLTQKQNQANIDFLKKDSAQKIEQTKLLIDNMGHNLNQIDEQVERAGWNQNKEQTINDKKYELENESVFNSGNINDNGLYNNIEKNSKIEDVQNHNQTAGLNNNNKQKREMGNQKVIDDKDDQSMWPKHQLKHLNNE